MRGLALGLLLVASVGAAACASSVKWDDTPPPAKPSDCGQDLQTRDLGLSRVSDETDHARELMLWTNTALSGG